MKPALRVFGAVSSTLIFLVGWVMVVGFALREWQLIRTEIRFQLVALAIAYPLPWLTLVFQRFANRRIVSVCYVILLMTIMLLLQFVPRAR
jgi:hypothetical protein